MDQVQRGTSNTISVSFYDGERPVTLTSATLGVTGLTVGTIVATGTSASAVQGGWSYVLPPVAECGLLTATWTGEDADSNVWSETQTIEVVGAFYFRLADLKSLPDINDNDTYNGLYADARQWIETLIERTCNTSFVERYRVDPINPSKIYTTGPYPEIVLNDPYPRRILGVTLDTHVLSGGELATLAINGRVVGPASAYSFTPSLQNLWANGEISYVAGYSTEPPEDLRIAALTAARNRLIAVNGASGIPSRARSITNQVGNISLSTAGGPDHPTGLDDVDAVICGWRDNVKRLAFA